MGTILEDLVLGNIGGSGRSIGDQLIDVSLDQVSGGNTSGNPAASDQPAPTIDTYIAEEGGILAVAYGEHLVAGHLVVHQFSPGPPPDSIFVQALGDGEWDSAVKVWYAGEELSVTPDTVTPGYRFHRGTISTGIADPVQGVDALLPAGQAYSGTAYAIVKLPEFHAVEDRPDKFRGRFRCKRTFDYECDGSQLIFGYYVNPANVAVDGIRRYYERKYHHNPGFAYDKFRARINWPAWCDWWQFNQQLITWNDGVNPTRQIPRFECHIAFTDDVNLADFLDAVCATCGAFWQDDGEQITFLPPLRWPDSSEHPPVHHFTESNIIAGSFSLAPIDIRSRPNLLIARFRNLDDPFLTETTVEVRREELIKKVGTIRSERRFANMYISQAQRLLERQARIEADSPYICTLRGDGSSIHVLPGDYVQVSHPIPKWQGQRCLVLEVSVESAEKTADEVTFTLQKDDGAFYKDDVHTPIQVALAPFAPSNITNLTLWLEAKSLVLGDNSPVSTWNDKSASGFNFTQGTAINQPTYRANFGKPYLFFDGGDFLRRASLPILNLVTAQNFTIFIAVQDLGVSGRLLLHQDGAGYRFGASQGNGLLFAEMGAGTVAGFIFGARPVYYPDTPHVLEIYRSGLVGEIVVDGAVVVGTIPVTENVPAQTRDLDIGRGSDPPFPDTSFAGHLYGMTVFNRSLTLPERSQMRSYMATLINPGATIQFDPLVLSGMVFWLRAEGLNYNDNDPVSPWTDFSGGANDVTQSGSLRPLFKTNVITGKPAVLFDGSDDLLTRTDDDDFDFGTANFSIYIAVKKVSSDTNAMIFGKDTFAGSGNGAYFYLNSSGNYAWWNGGSDISGGGNDLNWHIFTIQRTGTGTNQLTIYRDGVQVGQGTDARNLSNALSLVVGGVGSNCANVYIAELVVQNGFASATDRANMHSYLNGRYLIF